jgi:hypothetical protein
MPCRTHIFSDILEGTLMKTKKSEQQYVPGEPGCWWISAANLWTANNEKLSTPTSDKILEVLLQ